MRIRVAVVAISILVGSGSSAGGALAHGVSPAGYVNPFGGTAAGAPNFGTGGGAANTYPGAVAPFGMLSWSPQTLPSTTNFASDYSYEDSKVAGFPLTHLSGAGCAVNGDFPITPTTAPVTSSPAELSSSDTNPAYASSFSHRFEQATPGYYGVTLNPATRAPIGVQLTAASRAGVGRFTFPAGATGSLLINAGGSENADSQAAVTIDPAARTITGTTSSGRFCFAPDTYTVYFAARFSRPFAAYGTWQKNLLMAGSTQASDTAVLPLNPPAGEFNIPGDPSGTAQAGGYVSFGSRGGPVEMRIGISYVSAQDAMDNLRREVGERSFAAQRAVDTGAWNRALGRLAVAGGSLADRRTFYTTLYHALLAPAVFSDENGSYVGMDGQVHRVAAGHAIYENYSGWDIYRSEIPLLAMLFPARAADMAASLVADEQQSGWLPKWSVANGQTDVMVGDPADPMIAAAWAFGARGFDVHAALAAMIKGATQEGVSSNAQYVERQDLSDYENHHYVPTEDNTSNVGATFAPTLVWGSVSTTLEYTTADFSLAQFAARAACDAPTYRTFIGRSAWWRNVYDPSLGWVAARSQSGGFASGSSATSTSDFVEGDAAQYTWMVPYDYAGLFGVMGGRARARAKLDAFLSRLNAGPGAPYAFLGNEPTLQTPYIYDWLGEPWRAQAIVRRAILGLYSYKPTGYPGNDDLGEMSSWYVLGALGLYPEIPGTSILALSSPLFPRITMQLAHGRLVLVAPRAGDRTPYIRSLKLNGRAFNRPWVDFAQLVRGGRLAFTLGSRPARSWGSGLRVTPPSYGPAAAVPRCG